MITSDTQLEAPKAVPQGEAPKDDLAVNSHPADGVGAPVLDGEVLHTERPNVNAMREAIEAQSEMEVGKPVAETQAEVKAEAEGGKEVTVEKGSGTQIIINIAGKNRTLGFSNRAAATAFIKDASAKFGKKFKLVATGIVTLKAGDRISWKLHQLSNETRQGVVTEVLPQNDDGLVIFDAKQEDLGGNPKGNVWGYMGLVFEINGQHVKAVNPEAAQFEVVAAKRATMAPQQDLDNDKPVTSGMSDISGAPSFKEASSEFNRAMNSYDRLKKKRQQHGEGALSATEKKLLAIAQDAKDREMRDNNKKASGWQLLKDTPCPECQNIGKVYQYSLPEKVSFYCTNCYKDWSTKKASGDNPVKKYKVYTGPTLVQSTAEKLRNAGVNVTVEGTEHVHFTTDKGRDEVLKLLREPYQAETGAVGWSDRDIKEAAFNFSPSAVPSQVVQEFYPELQHELISYPNVTNAPMQNPEITGDAHELGTGPAEGIGEATLVMNQEELLPGAIQDAFEGMTRIGYISTSPAGGAGIGRDGKPQVLEGLPLRKENDIRGPMFMEEFNAQYDSIPGGLLQTASAVISKKVAAAEEKKQFGLFLKKVMGEVAASFIAAFKVTSKMPMNKVPGVGEIQLAQIEQATNTSAFNIVNTGSRVKYLMEKLTDSEIQDAINDAYAQGAIWHEGKEGGFVYEVFVRAETIDTESMILKYKFVTGTKEAED